ncbi:hypothetical protein XavaCFBP5823_05950 [Xanthomonas axonopodis pv. vasculorum]|nr:hypothetical protein XavaCFBP5823_05950 [Xanthomonas axonopodis pv. vasculorum]
MSRLRDLHAACCFRTVCLADSCLYSPASASAFAVRLLGRLKRVTRVGVARLPVAGRQER